MPKSYGMIMKREKSVRVVDDKHQRKYRSRSSSFRAEMANKYSYVFWVIVAAFILILWIGLYFGFVVPVENSIPYESTDCTTVQSTLLPKEHNMNCPCTSTPCPDPPKSYPCIQIYVNYTVNRHKDPRNHWVKFTKLHFSESVVGHNCSYLPYCEQSQPYITYEVNAYFTKRKTLLSSFKCYYNRHDENQVIDVNYSSKRLAILLPFTVVLLVLLGVISFRLYRRGCGCHAKRRPSRLSFISAVDEPIDE